MAAEYQGSNDTVPAKPLDPETGALLARSAQKKGSESAQNRAVLTVQTGAAGTFPAFDVPHYHPSGHEHQSGNRIAEKAQEKR